MEIKVGDKWLSNEYPRTVEVVELTTDYVCGVYLGSERKGRKTRILRTGFNKSKSGWTLVERDGQPVAATAPDAPTTSPAST